MSSSHGARRRLRAAALTLVAVFLIGAQLPAGSQPSLRIHVGQKAPNFTLPSSSGRLVKLSSFAGHNVLLDFYEGYW